MIKTLFNPLNTTTTMKTSNLLYLLLLLTPLMANAQNDLQGKTVKLIISEQTDESSGKTLQQSSIVRITDSKILWGATIEDGFPMTVTSISGSWDENSNIGKVDFELQLEDGKGTATIEGNSRGVEVIFNLNFSNGPANIKLKADKITLY